MAEVSTTCSTRPPTADVPPWWVTWNVTAVGVSGSSSNSTGIFGLIPWFVTSPRLQPSHTEQKSGLRQQIYGSPSSMPSGAGVRCDTGTWVCSVTHRVSKPCDSNSRTTGVGPMPGSVVNVHTEFHCVSALLSGWMSSCSPPASNVGSAVEDEV